MKFSFMPQQYFTKIKTIFDFLISKINLMISVEVLVTIVKDCPSVGPTLTNIV